LTPSFRLSTRKLSKSSSISAIRISVGDALSLALSGLVLDEVMGQRQKILEKKGKVINLS
jgi:hypothetical protein